MKTRPLHAILLTFLLLGVPAFAGQPCARPFLHPLFADSAVLQRGTPLAVWGWCEPGQEITVELAGSTGKAEAGADGRWEVKLNPLDAGGPHEMKISGPLQITLKNVMIGDVWVCSGQSNMQGNLERQNDAKVVEAADHPAIRFISHIPANNDNGTEAPLDVFGLTKGDWQVCTPKTADKLSRTAYYFGRELHERCKVPIGLIVVALNGSPIESWIPREALMSLPAYENDGQFYAADDPFGEIIPHWHLPSVRYNSLIHPLAPFGIKGFLWYQGETNASWRQSDNRYAKLLALMIQSWRATWGGQEVPFVTIQLPSTPRDKEMREPIRRSGWAEVQSAQAQSLQLPRTAVAICMDLGDGDLHPKTKDKIGARAALAARMVAYGEKIVGMGPTFNRLKIDGPAARISFDNIGGGLISRDGEPLRFFALAGEDRKFVWADAKIDGSEVVVTSPRVPKPVAVRYGWHQTGLVNLCNKEGLPASPFRTDEWDDPEDNTPRLQGPAGRGVAWDGTIAPSPFAALAWEVQRGNLDAVKAILAAEPEMLKRCNAQRVNLLNTAIAIGEDELAKLLLVAGADPNLPENSGLYPIHRAAQHGRPEILKLLLATGASARTETRNPGRATPLFFAAQQDQLAAVKLLLDAGADIETGRQFYRAGSGIEPHTPLWGAFEKTKDGSTACLLIERGARFAAPMPTGDFAIHLAARRNLPKAIGLLSGRGVDVNTQNQRKETPLEVAAGNGSLLAAKSLLEHGAMVSAKASDAARKRNGAEDMVKLLESVTPSRPGSAPGLP